MSLKIGPRAALLSVVLALALTALAAAPARARQLSLIDNFQNTYTFLNGESRGSTMVFYDGAVVNSVGDESWARLLADHSSCSAVLTFKQPGQEYVRTLYLYPNFYGTLGMDLKSTSMGDMGGSLAPGMAAGTSFYSITSGSMGTCFPAVDP